MTTKPFELARRAQRGSARRGFTLVELMVAGLIALMVVGSLTISMAQIGKARNNTKRRLDAALRADAAIEVLRRDVAALLRADDLFLTRLLIRDGSTEYRHEDEIALFITQLRPIRNSDNYTGEGIEYEVQYRIEWDDDGPALYQRRDVMPDETPLGGGTVTPSVDGILELSLEAYDGYDWYEEWDSDILGIPRAVRITVVGSGHREGEEADQAPSVVLRTVVAVDRVTPPRDIFEAIEEELNEQEAIEIAAEGGGGAGGDGGGLGDSGEGGAGGVSGPGGGGLGGPAGGGPGGPGGPGGGDGGGGGGGPGGPGGPGGGGGGGGGDRGGGGGGGGDGQGGGGGTGTGGSGTSGPPGVGNGGNN